MQGFGHGRRQQATDGRELVQGAGHGHVRGIAKVRQAVVVVFVMHLTDAVHSVRRRSGSKGVGGPRAAVGPVVQHVVVQHGPLWLLGRIASG